jgi:glycosyltransferase involved in cell wall biosynthesis
MRFLGGGERLCCDTIRVLESLGHEVTLLSETFDSRKVEDFFGFESIFEKIKLLPYPMRPGPNLLGTYSHLIHHIRAQKFVLKKTQSARHPFDLLFSTQDPGYIPDMRSPIIQWGYIPKPFPHRFSRSLTGAIQNLPLRLHYEERIERIGLVLAISGYSKWHLDNEWRRPSLLAYPACNMVELGKKKNLVVTAGRAAPEKNLDVFWRVARFCPGHEFLMLLTTEPYGDAYLSKLTKDCPSNGRIILNPPKEMYHRALGEARAYLHLMQGEHFGITIVEAMSAGCVPIVHDSGGPREIVDEKVGFRWQTEEQIPSMIYAAMKNSPSAIARERAQLFSRSKFDERIASIFSELRV